MAKIDSAYDYYVSVYGHQTTSRYDSHKKSDLRKIYNYIIKTNKESPLYKISNMDTAKRYAIDIKENAKSIQNVVASLSDNYGDFNDSFQKKVAYSSNEDAVSVTYVGDGTEGNSADNFNIRINRLASPQNNTGNFLKDNALSFIPGAYSFDLSTNASAYEFQYNVNVGETNLDVLTKLSNLMNNSNLGITAEVISDGNGASALSLTSKETGLSAEETELFSIHPGTSNVSVAAMDLLGIHHITTPAQNSDFELNGIAHSSLSNTFTINKAFSLTLKQTHTGNESTEIGFKANTDAVADNIQVLADAFNNIIKTAETYSGSGSGQGRRLLQDMSAVSKGSRTDLEHIGLMVAGNGSITINRKLLADAISPERAHGTYDILTRFKDQIGSKAESASINPMRYVDKVVVAYKNPGKNFAAPYISSIYSGMMLDSYI